MKIEMIIQIQKMSCFWDSHIKPDDDIDAQTKVKSDMVQCDKKECPNNIKEIWSDIYKDDVIKSQVESEKVENWAFISNNRDIVGLDTEKKNVSDRSHMIIEPIRSSKHY